MFLRVAPLGHVSLFIAQHVRSRLSDELLVSHRFNGLKPLSLLDFLPLQERINRPRPALIASFWLEFGDLILL